MPLFATPGGDGVFVDPSPHRPKLGLTPAKIRRLMAFRVWWDYYKIGLSAREIAEFVDKPHSTVKAGLKTFKEHLAKLRRTRSLDLPMKLVPAFGPKAYTPDRQVEMGADCRECQNRVRYDALVCPYCWRVSDDMQAAIDWREVRRLRKLAAVEANRARLGPPPADLTRKAEAAEKAEREAAAVGR